MRLLRALVVPCLLCAVLVVPAPAAAVRSQTAMLQELNKVRSSHGVRRLRTSPKLEQSAGGYAHWMMKNDWFGHRGAASGSGFARSGEILELHGGSRSRIKRTIRAWMNSPGHRAAILSSGFRHAGAGRSRGRFHGRRSVAWVVHFGGGRRK